MDALGPVKVGDRLVTEKGGVVQVTDVYLDRCFAIDDEVWNSDGSLWCQGFGRRTKYGPIIGREDNMTEERFNELKAILEDHSKRIAALEPKPEVKLPTEVGSIVKSGDSIFVRGGGLLPWSEYKVHGICNDKIAAERMRSVGFTVLLEGK